MRSDNLTAASWSDAGMEPPAHQSGPRCQHGVPLTLACRQCADPLGVEPWRPEPAARPRPCRAAALALAALALGVALGRLSR